MTDIKQAHLFRLGPQPALGRVRSRVLLEDGALEGLKSSWELPSPEGDL